MTKYQARCHEMFVRVRDFRKSFPALFPAESPGDRALSAVTGAVAEIDALVVAQVTAVDNRRWRARERAGLTRSLLLVARAARQLARVERRVDRTFVMPSPRTDGSLLETARLFLREAAPMEERFVELGMAPRFLADLRDRADGFERAVRRRRDARTEAAAAKAGMTKAFKCGFDAVLTLDVVMANLKPEDPVALATWKSARRVDRARKRQVKRKRAATRAVAQ